MISTHSSCARNIGVLTYRYGQLHEAERLLLDAFTKQQESSGGSAAVSAAMGFYGSIQSLRGRHTEAVSTLRNAVGMSVEFAGAASPVAVQNRIFLARALAGAGDLPAAVQLLTENFEMGRKQLGEQHVMVLRTSLEQARLAVENGDAARAEPALLALIPRLRKLGAPGLPALTQALVARGDALLSLNRPAEAVPLLDEAVRLRETFLWDQSWELAEARERLGEALGPATAAGKALLTRAAKVLASQLGEQHPFTLRAREALGG